MNYGEVPMAARRGKVTRAVPESWRRIIDECIAKALGNSFRQQILWILNERVASPSEIAVELGESLNRVCHHIAVLEKAACIELAYVKAVGNRLQHFYKATSRAFLDGADWPSVPESVKEGMRATLLRNVLEDAINAVVEGTYDARDGSHMSWTPMILDELGLEEMAEVLEDSLLRVMAVQETAKERLISSGAAGTPYTVSILGYPSAHEERKVGPPSDAKELVTSTSRSRAKAKKRTTKTTATKAKTKAKGSTGKATPKAKRRKKSSK
jgi:DNA-binding transcriptional ArsR family regulator